MAAYTFVIVLLVIFDQFFKLWAYNVTAKGVFSIIPGLFSINYIQNYGAAFSTLQGKRWLLIGVTSVVLAFILYLVYTKKVQQDTAVSGMMLIAAGGLSNLMDRAFRGYVIDYLDFSAIFNFPVFNLADVCVVLGTAMLLYYVFIIEPREKKKLDRELAEKGDE